MLSLVLTADYKYDLFGNRNEKAVTDSGGTTTTRFALNGWNPANPAGVGTENFNVLADLDGSSSLITRYLHGDKVDQLLARIDLGSPNATYWTLTDRLGSVRDVIDNGGVIKDSLRYDGFGNIDLASETNAAFRGRYAWTGREIDVETGLQYNRARYYDPTTGRWISQDPLGFDAGDSNLYRYVANKSTNAVDPSGFEVDKIGIFVSLQNKAAWTKEGNLPFRNKTANALLGFLIGAFPAGIGPRINAIVEGGVKWKVWGGIVNGAKIITGYELDAKITLGAKFVVGPNFRQSFTVNNNKIQLEFKAGLEIRATGEIKYKKEPDFPLAAKELTTNTGSGDGALRISLFAGALAKFSTNGGGFNQGAGLRGSLTQKYKLNPLDIKFTPNGIPVVGDLKKTPWSIVPDGKLEGNMAWFWINNGMETTVPIFNTAPKVMPVPNALT